MCINIVSVDTVPGLIVLNTGGDWIRSYAVILTPILIEMLMSLAEQQDCTIPISRGVVDVDVAQYARSRLRHGGKKTHRCGRDPHGCPQGSLRKLRSSSRCEGVVDTHTRTYTSTVPGQEVPWSGVQCQQQIDRSIVWAPTVPATCSLLWQYRQQPGVLSWPYMLIGPHNHHSLTYPFGTTTCCGRFHPTHHHSYEGLQGSGDLFVPDDVVYIGRLPHCESFVPSLSDDEKHDKAEGSSYGQMYTPDAGAGITCNDVSLENTVDSEGEVFLRGLMAILASMMEIGDDMERQRILDHSSVSHPEFTGTYTPCISLWNYLHRLSKFFHCSSECFVLALVYLDRAVKATSTTMTPLYVTSYNVYRLFLTSLLLAVKFNDDFYYANRRYAEVGCLTSTAELNGLEATMLKLVDFSLYVGPEEYVCYWELIFSVSPVATIPLHDVDGKRCLSRTCSESTTSSWIVDDNTLGNVSGKSDNELF